MALFGDKKEKKTEKAQKRRVTRTAPLTGGVAHEIVRAPWFSEKALIATEKGVYVFVVPPRATKAEIAGAIKEVYKVEPRAVRIANLPGKRKAMRTKRGMGTRAARTKAYVTLNAGDSIQFA
jgi:large subunit ribosomal protein L23